MPDSIEQDPDYEEDSQEKVSRPRNLRSKISRPRNNPQPTLARAARQPSPAPDAAENASEANDADSHAQIDVPDADPTQNPRQSNNPAPLPAPVNSARLQHPSVHGPGVPEANNGADHALQDDSNQAPPPHRSNVARPSPDRPLVPRRRGRLPPVRDTRLPEIPEANEEVEAADSGDARVELRIRCLVM